MQISHLLIMLLNLFQVDSLVKRPSRTFYLYDIALVRSHTYLVVRGKGSGVFGLAWGVGATWARGGCKRHPDGAKCLYIGRKQ